MSQKGTALLATNPVQKDVGAKDHTTVKSLARSTVVHNATKDDVLGPNRENAAIFSVQEDVPDQNSQIVW